MKPLLLSRTQIQKIIEHYEKNRTVKSNDGEPESMVDLALRAFGKGYNSRIVENEKFFATFSKEELQDVAALHFFGARVENEIQEWDAIRSHIRTKQDLPEYLAHKELDKTLKAAMIKLGNVVEYHE